eukprot:CAMPEP_0178691382 /NCGR_PEP_ID=MMETSP0699-20121125/6589_1 /TAXON_ID=265572 /ORGANISM="Extubocellulus spinifer, Strain CCMP396" /LENGTH=629 /DNA_ID=CAMNT_0020336603 /DNA_START=171 /DNA_END=2060 /DNA_ORIENTATION=-
MICSPLLQDLPLVVSTGRILPFVESSDLLSFRAASTGCYRLVHGPRGYSASTNSSDNDTRNDVGISTASGSAARDGAEHDRRADEGGDDGNDDDDQKQSESLWRQMLAHDFGFCYEWDVRCGDPDGTLKGNMHLRTFRSPDDGEAAQGRFRCNSRGQRCRSFRSRGHSFLRTDEEMVASNAFESWKRWEKLRLAFNIEARGGWVPLGNYAYDPLYPNSHEKFFIVGPFFLRCAKFWRSIENWCQDINAGGRVGRHILKSLNPGRALPFTKSTLPYYDPDDPLEGRPRGLESLMAMYSFYEGQDNGQTGPPPRGTVREEDDMSSGLLGSYSAPYGGYRASTRLRAPVFGGTNASAGFEVAVASIATAPGVAHARKIFALNMVSGRMELQHTDPNAPGQLAAPTSTITPRRSEDAIILWMNEYANRLVNGTYRVGKSSFVRYEQMSVLLYPNRTIGSATNECGSRVSSCVTRGVEIVASAVHAYEINRAIYSVRIRIVQPGEKGYESPSERGFHSCQLRSRRWTLTSTDSGETDHISGDGVTGLYPLLLDDGGHRVYAGQNAVDATREVGASASEAFVYQRVSNVYEGGGTMSGTLQFVPGSIRQPMGPEFDVVVASFPLPNFVDGDQYIY